MNEDWMANLMSTATTKQVEPGRAIAFEVKAGTQIEFRPRAHRQVLDLNLFRLDDPRERFSASVTRPVFGSHLSAGAELRSNPPWERSLATIVKDTVRDKDVAAGDGLHSHDLLFGRCSRALRQHIYGTASDGCQEALAAAIAPYGLTELDVHDPFNIFMRTGIHDDGTIFFVEPVANSTDHLDLHITIDLLVAVSACPGMSSGRTPGGALITVTAP